MKNKIFKKIIVVKIKTTQLQIVKEWFFYVNKIITFLVVYNKVCNLEIKKS